MESKLMELRAAMAREKSAREGVRGMMAAGDGALWQSSRPQALRVRNGNRKLRELSAEELERIQRAKAAELPAGSALKMVRVRSAEARRRLEPLDHANTGATTTTTAVTSGASGVGVPPGHHRGYGYATERPSSSSSSRPGSRGGVVTEHVVISSQQWGGQTQHQPYPPGPGPGGGGGGGSRPSSRGGRGGMPPAYPSSVSHGDGGGGMMASDYEPLPPPPPAGLMDELEEMGGGGTGYIQGTGAGGTYGGTAAVAEEDAEYFPPGWETGRRGDADVLSLAADDGAGAGASGGKKGWGNSGYYGDGGNNDNTTTTRGGVQIVNETESAKSLLDGEYDESANAASFAEALKEWRSGGRHDPDRPTTASLATMEVQTEAPVVVRAVSERPQTARPGAAKPGASYFQRMYAANVERMAAKDAMDTLQGKRPGTASGRPASARPNTGGT